MKKANGTLEVFSYTEKDIHIGFSIDIEINGEKRLFTTIEQVTSGKQKVDEKELIASAFYSLSKTLQAWSNVIPKIDKWSDGIPRS